MAGSREPAAGGSLRIEWCHQPAPVTEEAKGGKAGCWASSRATMGPAAGRDPPGSYDGETDMSLLVVVKLSFIVNEYIYKAHKFGF